ncbi:DUF2149 domain-containing protein [Vibrio methylphosphonaticus]|uniref:DUF2149 domain-containing protein n=1 Tax=Vibrio methylphosphonaticus TaxID=2946866 RepID=UPI00202A2431|nr:DUF2149 domain-containing protein [Vibrio methylphosphonaticus]MCL9774928.1 DUF2149 domain-containing protein [Vibrio methylphosphonaticus]
MRFLEAEDADDPILSIVNMVDLFAVVMAFLMMLNVTGAQLPENSILVENPGEKDMRITIKDGETLTRYERSEEMGEGTGTIAGQTYKLDDGRLVYVPE